MSTTAKVLIGVAVGIFALCGGCGVLIAVSAPDEVASTGDRANTPAPAAPSDAPATAGPGASAADPAPVGTEVSPAAGWTITVTGANFDADAAVKAATGYATPQPGKQYMTVDLVIVNGSDRPDPILTNMKLSMLGPSGVAVDREFLSGLPNEIDSFAQLQPGATVTGTIAWQVPAAEVQSVVLLAEPQFTLDENEDQRFLALK